MEETKAQKLLKKYLAGNCTEEEKAMLESWYLQQNLASSPTINEAEQLQDKRQIFAALRKANAPINRSLYWSKTASIAAAAIALIFVSFTLYNYLNRDTPTLPKTTQTKTDIIPGGNKAVLTLASGQIIDLSSDKKGIVIKAGELAYDDGTEIKGTETNKGNNTITTPIGGQYQVILTDGTKVWLNAASSLSYPTNFSGGTRSVTITGEAYFEVAHNKKMPFKVSSKGQTVEVLGTHFNVMAYDNETAIKTTLIEGSVKVSHGNLTKYLKPGQQAQVKDQNMSISSNVDMEEIVSWKNGYFKFNEDIKSIMNKISRWYDIDVAYQPGIDLNQTFSGEVSKSRNVSVLLKVMELTGNVHFKIEGRRIIVMP